WRLEGSDASSARYSIDILNGQTVIAKVIKTFKITPRSDDPKTPQGYEVSVSHRLENQTDQAIRVKALLNGPTAPPAELERQPDGREAGRSPGRAPAGDGGRGGRAQRRTTTRHGRVLRAQGAQGAQH